jgi:IS4 transposase
LKHVPWNVFERLVDKHQADYRIRRLTSKSQFPALLFGQLAGASSLREIAVRISTGKIIRLITNDLDAPAAEIAELYKQRWQIELFFKWIKQNLKIRHFLGASENAVRIQVYVAMITYLLLRAAQAAQKAIDQPLAFVRLVRLNLMHRRPINNLGYPPPTPIYDSTQMCLGL